MFVYVVVHDLIGVCRIVGVFSRRETAKEYIGKKFMNADNLYIHKLEVDNPDY